jgi:elongation factor 1-beta
MPCFGDVSTDGGLEKLNSFLLNNSYAGGWIPSQIDVKLFNSIKSAPNAKFENALRWWTNIDSYKAEFESLPAGGATCGGAAAPAAAEEEDDDDVDLFGSDDEVDEEAERLKAERIAAYNERREAKEAKKGKVIAKSNIILDIKPWDDETPLEKMEQCIKSIKMDGLLWGTHKFVAVGYGIKKLQITCVIEDDKVMMDDLEDAVTGFEDYVQSMDIVAFNKI